MPQNTGLFEFETGSLDCQMCAALRKSRLTARNFAGLEPRLIELRYRKPQPNRHLEKFETYTVAFAN